MDTKLTRLAINTIKMLAVDAVEKANCGHPGMPMGAADYAFILWNQYLRYNHQDPNWPNRDRFVLSSGHGSMLLYALLHLAGFDMSLGDLKQFRQWESKTPGHPELGCAPGVEATTGPLGQGVGNAVGMAISAAMMAQRFNREDFQPIDHYVYAIVSDGDLMEGISSEAASLAGHLGLSKLIFIYDDNHISIDGETEFTFTEDVAKRFEAFGWFTQRIDGHNHSEIMQALEHARKQKQKPSLILARTHIAKDAPNKHDTSEAHGAPLGAEEVAATKKALGWPLEPSFYVPDEVRKLFSSRTLELQKEYQKWQQEFYEWRQKHPELADLWDVYWMKKVPQNLFQTLCESLPQMPSATRVISSELQQKVAKLAPSLVGGSADLNASTKTFIQGSGLVTSRDFGGRNFHFGIREHGMASIMNGIALYGSFVPFGSTFLIFSDYMRPSIRVAALSKLQGIYIFTHDSVFLGEDGPTHQPIEHLGSLRLIPNLAVVRPADSLECAAAWHIALSRKQGPTAICLTRQKIPALERDPEFRPENVLRGGYIVCEASVAIPDLILISTGSELHLAIAAKKNFDQNGIKTRVVSMPCVEIFAEQDEEYRKSILTPHIPMAVIEAAQCDLWHRWIGSNGLTIGIDRFGASAPDKVIAEKFGFTLPQITQQIEDWFNHNRHL